MQMLVLAPFDVVAASAFHRCGSLSHSDALCKAESVAKCVLQSLQSFGSRKTCLQSAFIVVSGFSSCCFGSSLLFDNTRPALDRCRSQACQAGCLFGVQGLRHAGES